MTDEEARTVKRGQTLLWFRQGHPPALVRVRNILPGFRSSERGFSIARLDRPGHAAASLSENLQLIPRHQPDAANVYADFLEEAGEPRAAALLRQAFPLADGR